MVTNLHSKATSEDMNGTGKHVTDLIDKSEVQDAIIVDLNTELKKANEKLTLALNKNREDENVRLANHYENLRDKGLICFFKTIKGATYRLNDDIAEAALKIYSVIKRHGTTMYDLPQDVQTSRMASMFTEFKQTKLAAALGLTNTQILVDEIDEVNQKYLQAIVQKSDDKSKKEEPELVTENVKKVKVGMRKIMNYLDTVTSVTDNEALKTLNNGLINIIEGANRTIRARASRKENNKAE